MKDRTKLVILALISLVAWVTAYLIPQFPWTILFAIAPLFAIYDHHKNRDLHFVKFGFWVVAIHILVFGVLSSIKEEWASFPLSVNFGILLSFAFFSYWLTDTYARNRLGLFTILIYVAGAEYIGLLFVPDYAYMLLGSSLSHFPDIQQWTSGTGLTGVSMWILVANIGFYYVFFRDDAIFKGQLRWRSLIISLLLLLIPVLISLWFYDGSSIITPEEVRIAFTDIWDRKNMASAGEVAGRTCAWVAVFIILYGLVQRKVLK